MIRISPVATAQANRLLTTRSIRSIGECPYAVALRRKAGLKFSIREFRNRLFGFDLGFGISSQRVQWIIFVEIELFARAVN